MKGGEAVICRVKVFVPDRDVNTIRPFLDTPHSVRIFARDGTTIELEVRTLERMMACYETDVKMGGGS